MHVARLGRAGLLAGIVSVSACGDDTAASSATASEGEGASEGEATSAATGESTSDGSTGAGPGTTSGSATTSSGSGSESGDSDTGAVVCDPGPTIVSDQGLLRRDEPRAGNVIDPCGAHRWYFVAPGESVVKFKISAGSEPIEVAIAYPDLGDDEAWEDPLQTITIEKNAALVGTFDAPRSGEFALHVAPTSAAAGATYDLEIECAQGCTRETTRFPIVLVHGWTGFEAIGPLEYFYQIKDTVEPLGFPVSVAVLDPYNASTIRGTQLADRIDEFLAQWRARKVDLIGHSQGGIDSRYAISSLGYGPQVSALLTIGSPHRGTYVTDLALGLAPGAVEVALAGLLNFVGAVTAQEKSDALASFESLSEAYMEGEFNPQNPDDPDVVYISYTGRTCDAIDFLSPKNQCHDLVDPLIGWSYDILKYARGANDGLVTVESAQWGEYRGEMVADHIDEVGQIGGITDADFDHKDWYLARIRELAGEGH